jgi:DNA-binding SARP family transcriptional activator/TolB-like protein
VFTLNLFGGIALAGPEGPLAGRVSQRRRLAVLAILGVAHDRGLRRERIVALLWPDADDASARHLLSDSLYVIRGALGEHALLVAGEDVRLNRQAVRCDVGDFLDALDAGELERAVDAYRGVLLDGFVLPDAPEFEPWLDGERERLARLHRRALETLAGGCAAAGDPAGNVRWLQRLAAADPLDAAVATRLVRALADSGDLVGALRHTRVHAARLRQALEVEPDEEFVHLSSRISAEIAARAAVAVTAVPLAIPELSDGTVAASHGGEAAGGAPPESEAVAVDVGRQPGEGGAGEPAPVAARQRATAAGGSAGPAARTRTVWRAGAVALLLVLVVGGPRLRGGPGAAGLDETLIVVAPFTVHGPAEQAYLSEGVAALLGARLDGAGEYRVVEVGAVLRGGERAGDVARAAAADPAALARRFGARLVVTGDIVSADGALQLNATLHDAAARRPLVRAAAAAGEAAALFQLVDRVAVRVLGGAEEGPGWQMRRIAAHHTASLEPFRHFVAGEVLYREGRFTEAAAAFEAAAAADSAFALAWYRLGFARLWAGVPRQDAFERARNASAGLPPRARLLVQAQQAYDRQDVDEADRLFRTAAERYPDAVEAWIGLG